MHEIRTEIISVWKAAGKKYEADLMSAWELYEFIRSARRAFRGQLGVLKRFLHESPPRDYMIDARAGRIELIKKHIKLLNKGMTAKVVALGKPDLSGCHVELTHFEHLLKMARKDLGDL